MNICSRCHEEIAIHDLPKHTTCTPVTVDVEGPEPAAFVLARLMQENAALRERVAQLEAIADLNRCTVIAQAFEYNRALKKAQGQAAALSNIIKKHRIISFSQHPIRWSVKEKF